MYESTLHLGCQLQTGAPTLAHKRCETILHSSHTVSWDTILASGMYSKVRWYLPSCTSSPSFLSCRWETPRRSHSQDTQSGGHAFHLVWRGSHLHKYGCNKQNLIACTHSWLILAIISVCLVAFHWPREWQMLSQTGHNHFLLLVLHIHHAYSNLL